MLNDPAGHRLPSAKPLTQSSHRLTKRCDGVHVRFEEGGPACKAAGVPLTRVASVSSSQAVSRSEPQRSR